MKQNLKCGMKQILNRVQYDSPNTVCHSELVSESQILKCVSHDNRFSFGRSMIEMLGVLSVIGVLSIAGLHGYRQAMIRYKANENIYYLNRVFAAAATVDVGTGDGVRKSCASFADGQDLPYGINCFVSNNHGGLGSNVSATMAVETTAIAEQMNKYSTAISPYTGKELTYYFHQGVVPYNIYSPDGEPEIEADKTSTSVTASFFTRETWHEDW